MLLTANDVQESSVVFYSLLVTVDNYFKHEDR